MKKSGRPRLKATQSQCIDRLISEPPIEQSPPLVLLRAFDAAGRHMSFSAAAQALGVTPSTISHQISSLEDWLRVSLFERRGRGLKMTTEGSELHASIAHAFEHIRSSSQQIRDRGESTRLRISATPFLASECLLPLLPAFRDAFPRLQVKLSGTEVIEDPRDRAVDFCFRVGGREEPGLERESLFPLMVAPVVGKSACDPFALPMVDFGYNGSSAWTAYEAHIGRRWPHRLTHQFSNHGLAMRAAEDGLGVALAVLPTTKPWVDKGRVLLLDDWEPVPFDSLYLVSRILVPSETLLNSAREWLKTHLKELLC